MKITMNTKTVLKLLQEHEKKHIEEYTKQIQGWKIAMETWQKSLSEWTVVTCENIYEANDSKINKQHRPQEPTKPGNYLDDYSKLIEFVKCHVDDKIILDEFDYDKIVKDKFNWRLNFENSTSLYSVKN